MRATKNNTEPVQPTEQSQSVTLEGSIVRLKLTRSPIKGEHTASFNDLSADDAAELGRRLIGAARILATQPVSGGKPGVAYREPPAFRNEPDSIGRPGTDVIRGTRHLSDPLPDNVVIVGSLHGGGMYFPNPEAAPRVGSPVSGVRNVGSITGAAADKAE